MEYDVVVIGGGTGGSRAAKVASEAGKRVVMFNDGELGGLCILRGCMPTKTMLHAAHLVHEFQHHHTPGVERLQPAVSFQEVMKNKDAKVERFKRAKIASIENSDYEVIDARAHFVGSHEVEADGKRYTFQKAVIATGSVSHIPPIQGIESVPYLTSDEVMTLTEQPRSIITVGIGPIGLELSQFFSRLGSEVHVVGRREIFCDVDAEISKEARAAFEAEPNFTLHENSPPKSVRVDGEMVVLTVEEDGKERELTAEKLIIATGRSAAVQGLGLEAAGVEFDGRRIVTKENTTETTNSDIYVAGDVTGEDQILHVANWEGEVAGKRAAGIPGDHRVENRLNMSVVFTDPPLATLGMTEEQAAREGREIVSASLRFPETGRAITQDVQFGCTKLIADKNDGEILGAHILGPRADDLIHIFAPVLKARMKAGELVELPWYHPTLAEVFLSLVREIAGKTEAR